MDEAKKNNCDFTKEGLMLKLEDYAIMFESHPLAQAVIDRDFTILLINEAFCKFTGYSRDKLIGMNFTDFKTKNLIQYLKDTGESVADAISQKRETVGESTFKTPSGLYIMIRFNHPILDEKNEVKYVYITYNDITKIVKNQEYMASDIEEITHLYDKMAAGDLTATYLFSRPDDPDLLLTYELLTKLKEAVHNIIINLQINIRDVNKRMLDLTSNADIATQKIESGSQSVLNISHNAEKVNQNTETMYNSIEDISKAMQDMSVSIEEITSNMNLVSILSTETNDISKKGAGLAGKAEQSMDKISLSSKKANDIVTEIKNQMSDISKIVVYIRDIANQTNLLALNASIEAARAGDAGRGFAVVASEVKSLAQESRNFAERINEMIGDLKNSTQNVSLAMDDTQCMVDEGAQMVTETVQLFNTIASSIEKVTKNTTEIAANIEEQAATTQEVTANVCEIATLVDKTLKEAANTATESKESSKVLNEISQMFSRVKNMAIEALEANKKFKVD